MLVRMDTGTTAELDTALEDKLVDRLAAVYEKLGTSLMVTYLNTNAGPTKDLRVRQAFALAIDREALAKFRKTVKPLVDFTPEGIFPRYEAARTKVYAELLKKNNISPEQWKKQE